MVAGSSVEYDPVGPVTSTLIPSLSFDALAKITCEPLLNIVAQPDEMKIKT